MKQSSHGSTEVDMDAHIT